LLLQRKKGYQCQQKPPEEFAETLGTNSMDFMSSGPVVAYGLARNGGVAVVRKITGSTGTTKLQLRTIRGDYTIDSYTASNFDKRAVRKNLFILPVQLKRLPKKFICLPKKKYNYRLVSEENYLRCQFRRNFRIKLRLLFSSSNSRLSPMSGDWVILIFSANFSKLINFCFLSSST
jgi:hypothetical protein